MGWLKDFQLKFHWLTLAGKVTNYLSTLTSLTSLEMVDSGEGKSPSEASRLITTNFKI
jgi:hypothetical protein